MILLPCSFKQHEPRYEARGDVPVEALRIAIGQSHILQHILKVLIYLVHYKSPRIPVLVQLIELGVAQDMVEVRHVTEDTDQSAVLKTSKEPGNRTPVVVGLIFNMHALHIFDQYEENIRFGHPG